MSLFPLSIALRRYISHGRLTVIDTAGRSHSFGHGDTRATIRLHDPRFKWRMLWAPATEAGDGYVDGAFSIEEGTLRDYLEILLISQERAQATPIGALRRRTGDTLRTQDNARRSVRNVRRHYDIDHHLYELFLDADLQYSCAYWRVA